MAGRVGAVSTTVIELPERHSAKAARLLAAAGDLLIGRGIKGFTIADVAQRAHVGKGTVYLYWPTKDDLLIGLIGRDFLGLAEDMIQMLDDDPDLARPSRFWPAMIEIATSQPLISALQRHDHELLGMLADHPSSLALHDALGPGAVLQAVLPIWRRHGLARTDWDAADQAFALHGLIGGIALSLIGPPTPAPIEAEDPLGVLGAAVTALLGPERATQKQIRTSAAEITEFLRTGVAAALQVITSPSSRE